MKRIGIIDNLNDIRGFAESRFHVASSADIMAATGGNTGNVAFVFGLKQLIGNPTVRIEWHWKPESVRQHVDQIIVCCANQIGAHADLGGWADKLAAIDLPVTLVGLGAQANSFNDQPDIPEGTRRFLAVVNALRVEPEHENISVRGEFTKHTLVRLETSAVATGCPSLLISSNPNLGKDLFARQNAQPVERVAVAAGNPWHGPSAFLERELVRLVDQQQGAYILQHPESMLQFALGERGALTEKTVRRFLEIYPDHPTLDALLNWYRHHAHAFIDAPNWMNFLKRFDLVVGPRYHGVALGIQAGVSGCVYTIDSRTQELCDGTGIKSVSVQSLRGMSPKEMVAASLWTEEDAIGFDGNRASKAKLYKEFLEGNHIEPSAHLIRQVAELPA